MRSVLEFDSKNDWLIDRGTDQPSVNLIVLSFFHPLKLFLKTNDTTTSNGLPLGMTSDIISYFKSKGIRVMLSIGGITYVDGWNQALSQDETQLGLNTAEVAALLGVGIEIDYEENTNPNLVGLQAFIDAYRSKIPYDTSGAYHPTRLTIDAAAGDRWLIALNRKATADWLMGPHAVLDYANAMVPSRQPSSATDAQANWKEHIDGKPQYAPPVLPVAPAKFTGGLYVAEDSKVRPEYNNFANSLQKSTGTFVQNVSPNGAGTSSGLLRYMFWAAEKPSSRGIGTAPPYSCEDVMGSGATAYSITIPMPSLRQQ